MKKTLTTIYLCCQFGFLFAQSEMSREDSDCRDKRKGKIEKSFTTNTNLKSILVLLFKKKSSYENQVTEDVINFREDEDKDVSSIMAAPISKSNKKRNERCDEE